MNSHLGSPLKILIFAAHIHNFPMLSWTGEIWTMACIFHKIMTHAIWCDSLWDFLQLLLSIQKTPRNCSSKSFSPMLWCRFVLFASQHHDTRQSQAKCTERSFYFLRERNEHKQAQLVGSWSRNFFLVSRGEVEHAHQCGANFTIPSLMFSI